MNFHKLADFPHNKSYVIPTNGPIPTMGWKLYVIPTNGPIPTWAENYTSFPQMDRFPQWAENYTSFPQMDRFPQWAENYTSFPQTWADFTSRNDVTLCFPNDTNRRSKTATTTTTKKKKLLRRATTTLFTPALGIDSGPQSGPKRCLCLLLFLFMEIFLKPSLILEVWLENHHFILRSAPFV